MHECDTLYNIYAVYNIVHTHTHRQTHTLVVQYY